MVINPRPEALSSDTLQILNRLTLNKTTYFLKKNLLGLVRPWTQKYDASVVVYLISI